MGNENSSPTDLKVEEIIKVSDNWVLKSAILTKTMTRICVFEQHFRDENVQNLQQLSKNLKVYRHPNILKYISSWRTNKTFTVATEFAQPLSLVVQELLPMQLCVGLFGVLKAITFLQEKASSSHNNISKDAIYVTSDGSWKLGRLELMTRKKQGVSCDSFESIDQKGFAVLANEILRNVTNDDIPAAEEFKQLCRSQTVTPISDLQFFMQLFSHAFFSHRFLYIYNFLFDLPGKNESEKTSFFETLADDLLVYPEEMVANILGSLLLSRLVALNCTAQKCLLPRIFLPKTGENSSLFSVAILQKYIAPKLLKMFLVRDSQIRLLLLKHFESIHVIFTKDQLQTIILPELLVAIKDTNETLVSDTLRTLADLVPILGASVVIGKERVKLFADGRPFVKKGANTYDPNSDLTSMVFPSTANLFQLPERLSPDGGEDVQDSTQSTPGQDVLDTDRRDDNFNLGNVTKTNDSIERSICESKTNSSSAEGPSEVVEHSSQEIMRPSARRDEDLTTLDIKYSRSKHNPQIDNIELIFRDMEPVISPTAIMEIPNVKENIHNKFTAAESDGDYFDGWNNEIENEWISSDTEV